MQAVVEEKIRAKKILDIRNLCVYFPKLEGQIKVLRYCSLNVKEGEIVGLVGESGSGKSMTAMSCLGLVPKPGITSGSITIDGRQVIGVSESELNRLRGGTAAIIFQNPMTALNPFISIGALSVTHLHKQFHTVNGVINAVDSVSFDIEYAQTLALVGESGCGKSTIASAILRLIDIQAGEIIFEGQNVLAMNASDLQKFRQRVSIVFQNPFSSLNPKMKIKSIVGEPLQVCYGIKGEELTDRVVTHLENVGLGAAHLNRYPHQFSGGQRQRISIARALALEPKILILDEPTAALDVSVQAQVLNLLQELKQRLGLAYLFISHNLATVEYIADRVMVMYLGKIVEQGSVQSIFRNPRHPYTRALLDSVPSIDPTQRNQLRVLKGDLPDPLNLPPGCAFFSRCGQSKDKCKAQQPELQTFNSASAFACYNPNSVQ